MPVIASPSRVAVVLHEPDLGGATRSLLRALPALEERGWEFSFWSPGRGSAASELRQRGYAVSTSERLLRFSARSLREPPGAIRRLTSMPAYLRSFRAWLAAQDAALVHVNTLLALPELVSRPRPGPPVVLHTHEVLPSGSKGALAGRLARGADVIVAVSEAVGSALRRYGVESRIVHPGVSLPSGDPRPRDHDRLVVGTIGTVCRRKGSDLFLAAMRQVREARNGIEFRIVGEAAVGGERAWAEELLARARREGLVHRTGVDPYTELADWDVFVLPSRMDPCPLAVLEAMACRIPVVGTRVGGIPEEIGDGAGVLVEPEDVGDIASAVLRLAESPEQRASLGEAGRRRVESLFSLERQAEGLDGAYRAAARLRDAA